MNFEAKPVLNNSAFFWFDEKNQEGIEFYGPDSIEWMQFDLDTKRAYSVAQRKVIEDKITEDNDKISIHNAVICTAWRKALIKVFKSSKNITLSNKEIAKENCGDLFDALPIEKIIAIGSHVSKQESFLKKP